MKTLAFGVLIAVIIGGLVGTLLLRDPGYVLITYANVAVETSLWVGLLVLIAVYFLLRVVGGAVHGLSRGQLRLSHWRSGRKQRRARRQTLNGLLLMAEGRYAQARDKLLAAAPDVETPLINLLQSARAEHELGNRDARDRCLRQALQSTPNAAFAVTLAQTEFHMDNGLHEQALAALLDLHQKAPKHKTVLAMLATCYVELEEWQALQNLLPDLEKYDALTESELRKLHQQVWRGALLDSYDPARIWKKLPGSLRADTSLMCEWVEQLQAEGRIDVAEQAARLALEAQWSSELVRIYGGLRSSDPAQQLAFALGFRKEHGHDSELNLALGRLCLANEQFEQARDYFDTALKLAPSDAAYGELGRLCMALGDEQRGAEYLLRAMGHLPQLPLPRRGSEPGARAAR